MGSASTLGDTPYLYRNKVSCTVRWLCKKAQEMRELLSEHMASKKKGNRRGRAYPLVERKTLDALSEVPIEEDKDVAFGDLT